MDISNRLTDHTQWENFLYSKRASAHLCPWEDEALSEYISNQQYLEPARKVLTAQPFSPPRRVSISKMHSEKKRIVYIHEPRERTLLKFLTHQLNRKYDYLYAPNLYSFRPGLSVRNAVEDLLKVPGIGQMYSYKVDISNYFNSVPVAAMISVLTETMNDDPVIRDFLASMLLDTQVLQDGQTVSDPNKGIMAGTPISTFLANLYLKELDLEFAREGRIYARYSDDIITFAPTQEALEENIRLIHDTLQQKGLTINPKKESRTQPSEAWVFLGFLFKDGRIDIAPASVEKLKAKMRRKSRALMRWKDRKGATGEAAAKAFIRVFNRKLFDNPIDHELTWARWYFPLITTTQSLRQIDHYCQSCIRFLVTGKRNKTAYRCRYEDMKKMGYVSLVNRYFAHSDPEQG